MIYDSITASKTRINVLSANKHVSQLGNVKNNLSSMLFLTSRPEATLLHLHHMTEKNKFCFLSMWNNKCLIPSQVTQHSARTSQLVHRESWTYQDAVEGRRGSSSLHVP